MLTLLEQIDKGTLWRSHGGVHPPELKSLSNKTIISELPLASQYILPLTQVGDSALLAVKVGDRVLKGQSLTKGTSFAYSPVHAPTSGFITQIQPMPSNHASGIAVLSCVIDADGADESVEVVEADVSSLSNQEILSKIQQAGIAGLGGAAFPTHIKLSPASDIELVIINGVECEPYITSDDRLMREHSDEILSGIAIIQKLLKPKRIIIAIEDNKPEAIEAMQHALNRSELATDSARITAVPTKYPSGGEKQLIQILTGQEVPSGSIPAQLGMLVQNVGTAYAIHDAVVNGLALTRRVVTVTGLNSQAPGNYWVPIGTPVSHLLQQLGFSGDLAQDKVIIGGPMMGHSLPDTSAPVLKGTNCVLLPSSEEIAPEQAEKPCIRCGECAVVCPTLLLPQQLFWHAKAEEYDKAASFNLHDCIECGCCSYVCPSDIPLVEYYRIAKSAIRTQTEEKKQADFAKQRFEARVQRLEEEKLAREAKAKEAAERRKTTMSSGDRDAVAEAMARIKAKKAAESLQVKTTPAADDKKAQVAAAVARAKAKKGNTNAQVDAQPTTGATPADDKKAQVAAAIARAKAKKATQAESPDADTKTEAMTAPVNTAVTDKKAQVAAAIARAKAKKAAQAGTSEADVNAEPIPTTVDTAVTDKKAQVAAAIARAKAKKAALAASNDGTQVQHSEVDTTTAVSDKTDSENAIVQSSVIKPCGAETSTTDSAEDAKKARIAAAVAKAKAKKQSQAIEPQPSKAADSEISAAPDSDIQRSDIQSSDTQTNDAKTFVTETSVTDTPVAESAADVKKARIAAAVAKAKAKKQSQALESQPNKVADSETQNTQTSNVQVSKAETSVAESVEPELAETKSTETLSADDAKKARIAAAVAKAKAKKLQQKLQEKE
ncbi:electron transport complex subunit RsxC [Shewanella schlegeliana]|uniref:Ion-translocating oxidoreductase complex subunit C n=1 Tax=Shewanella schlegeliana TaxID=190308 RepID=A0ABS1SU08_9GAMM|nr:electron transport complex subunit RsxC [Shewanella schlegeliana]MBL4912029.1 electron transport complex subunit RsxC [Shewanella schlegeliana]MCL1111595.1 electron transport complex subunit RsxC [Shewanella schlegeliana]GIU35397.1 electron transport complex subunit C [Shewanella schlegeliana]